MVLVEGISVYKKKRKNIGIRKKGKRVVNISY